MNRVYLDLETTGLDDDNSIVEVSAVYYKGDKIISQFNARGYDSSAITNLDALKVNKYTFTELKKLCTEKDLLMGLFDWLLGLEGNPDLAGINIQFDMNLIKARAKKYNIITGSVLPYRLHDISNIARFLVKIGLLDIKNSGKGNSLKDLVVALNIPFNEEALHTAIGDVNLYYPVDIALEQLVLRSVGKIYGQNQ